jgi:hypothetical protein
MTAIFTIASGKIFNKPEFETFGIAMLAIMTIYYVLMTLETGNEPRKDI